MAVIKKKGGGEGGGHDGKKRRRSSHKKEESLEQKVKYDASSYALNDNSEAKVQEVKKHPLESWTTEQVQAWAKEEIPKFMRKSDADATIKLFNFDGATLYQVDRQFMIDNSIKAKEKVTGAIDELKAKLAKVQLDIERAELRKQMMQKKKKSEWDDQSESDDEDPMDKIAEKRRKLKELWTTPKSIRDMSWFRKDLNKANDRAIAEEEARFRVMEKLSKFERDRLDVEKFQKKLQGQRDFYRLTYPQQQTVHRSKKAVRNLMVQMDDKKMPPVKQPTFSKCSYIRNKFVQQNKASCRPKCKPQLLLRSLKQRLPGNERWKVRWLQKEGDFSEYDATKALIDNRFFLSAAHTNLMKMARRTGSQKERVEKYRAFLRTVHIFRKIPEDAIEEIACGLEEKRYASGNKIIKEKTSGSLVYVLFHGRVVASRLVRLTGIVKPQLIKEFKKAEYFGIRQPYEFDATSIGDSLLLAIRRDLIEKIIGPERLKKAAIDTTSMADRTKLRSKSAPAKRRKKKKKKSKKKSGMTGNKWLGGDDDDYEAPEQGGGEQTSTPHGNALKRKSVSFAGVPDSDEDDDDFDDDDGFAASGGWGGGGMSSLDKSMTVREALGF